MEPTEVVSVDDILSAADTRLHKPVEPITTPAAKGTKSPAVEPETEVEEPETEVEEPETEVGPDETPSDPEQEPTLEVDGEKLTPAQVRELRAENKRAKQSEQDRLAAQYLLDHPEEYERLRAERGGAPATPKEPERPAGPNPLTQVNEWKFDRFNQYVNYLQSVGKTASPKAIQDQVELDFNVARTEQMHADIMADRKDRDDQKKQRDAEQAAWREQQEANQIAKTLEPLFAKYPRANTTAGREDVEAHLLRAIYTGKPVDYEAIVKRVAGATQAAVKDWADKKKTMAAGTGPARASGGSARGTQQKLKDTMPADVSSIMEYAELKSRGQS